MQLPHTADLPVRVAQILDVRHTYRWQCFVARLSPLSWKWRQQVPANPSKLSSELESATVTSHRMQTFIVTAQQIAACFVLHYTSRCLPLMQTWHNSPEQGYGNVKETNFSKLIIMYQWRTEGGLGCSNGPPPDIPKALRNLAKLNPILKTVKNCWI